MTNRLARETSPYLLQHADNPVAWQPWDAAALAQAERENRPILLSIGYSACHWCHVMAHESFEDESTAALMNELFVNIKVDREERPDLDRIYQIAHQLLARRPGGWPLTVFLTPRDRMPFFAGTYFPRLPRHGMPAFGEMLQRVAAFHREHAADIAQQNDSLADVFRRIEQGGRPASGAALNRAPIQAARQLLETEFDARHGGFGGAPKFPQPGALALFLGAALRGDRPAERMALFSLERMAAGGLFDQVGGGFFRYCVDAAWEIPHFEKMLYDNAALLPLYAEAAAHSGASRFREAVTGTAAWLAREMRLDGGAFAASLDADNPEGEGANYTWSREELEARLPEDDLHLLERLYGLDAPPNFEGRWHLNLRRTPEQLGTAAGTDPDAVRRHRDAVHARLLDIRQQRTPPGRDDKCLTAWNALLVTGLVRAGLLLDEPDLCRLGETALHWLDRHAWAGDRLHSVWTDGAVRQPAFLDDVAFLLQAQLTALQYRWQAATLARARALADLLLREFEDTGAGGFFFTPANGERLIHRPKSFADESLPAGNAVAAASLLQLGWLLGENRYLTAAERCLQAATPALERAPQAHCSLLNALDDFLDPPPQVILRGGPEAMAAFRGELPADARVALFAIPADAEELPPALQAHAVRGDCVAYLCRGTHCEAPCTEPSELAGRLREQP